MAKSTNEYGADGSLTTTIQNDPVQTAPQSNFFWDLARIRSMFQPPQQQQPVQPTTPKPTLGMNPTPPQTSTPLPNRGTMTQQAAAMRTPREQVFTRAISPLSRNQSVENAGSALMQTERVAPGTPGAAFSGYSDTPYDPSLIRGSGPDVFQQGRGGNAPSPVRGTEQNIPQPGSGGDENRLNYEKARMAEALRQSNAAYEARVALTPHLGAGFK